MINCDNEGNLADNQNRNLRMQYSENETKKMDAPLAQQKKYK